jgi:hypothetical protein
VSSFPVPAPCVAALRHPRRRLVGLLVALVVAGCTAGGLPTPQRTVTPVPSRSDKPAAAPSTTRQSSPTLQPSPTGAPSPDPIPGSGPPEASLRGTDGQGVPGILGSWVWDGAGADAPWLVPPAGRTVTGPGPYEVSFEPEPAITGWTVGWAPVVGGTAGPRAGGERGGAGPVELHGPDRPGTWSLQVDVRFGEGRHAAWYWRLELAP